MTTMDKHEFESLVLGSVGFPMPLSSDASTEVRKLLPPYFSCIEPNSFTSLLSILLWATIGRKSEAVIDLKEKLQIFIEQRQDITQFSLRGISCAIKLLNHCSQDLTNHERGLFSGQLITVLSDYTDYIYNMLLLRDALLNCEDGLFAAERYFSQIRLTRERYFYIDRVGIYLYETLSHSSDSDIRSQCRHTPARKRGELSFFLEEITAKVKQQLDYTIGPDARSKRILQVISSGRSGTYFLRTQLLMHSENIVPIHNIYTIPSLSVRSLLSIAQSYSLSKSNKEIPVSKEQLSILAAHVERHLLVFSTEILAYMSRFNKFPVIINHWWSPFAFLLKSIFPNLEFLSLTRDREELMHSMVDKYQIYSNPMPPDLHFSDYEPREESKSELINWSNYFLDLTDQLQAGVARMFPDSCHGSISLTPPNMEAGKKLIQIFNLSCSTQELINTPKINHKERVR